MIERNRFFTNDGININRDLLSKDLEGSHNLMYLQSDICVIDLKTSRATVTGLEPDYLSKELDTTVISLSLWEDEYISIFTNGSLEFELSISYDNTFELNPSCSERFVSMLKEINSSKNIYETVGDHFSRVFSLLDINLEDFVSPNVSTIKEAVSYDFYGKW